MIHVISQEEYYIAPSQEIFDDIKQATIEVWKSKDDTYGYATEKVNRIKDIKNVTDNYAYMIAMFDSKNKGLLFAELKREDSRELVASLMFTEAEELRKMMAEHG